MAVDTAPIKIDPYTSTVPLVQIPPEQMQITPAQPLQGQFGKKGTAPLAIGDAIFKGLMQGHEEKAKRKYAQAQATISAVDSATDAAYQKYQDALSQASGKVDDPAAKAAYDAYVGVFNQSKAAKAQFVIPQKPQKGQAKPGGGKDQKNKIPGMGGIKEFMEANPHLIPQVALLTMQPKGPGLSAEQKLQSAEIDRAQAGAAASKQEVTNLQYEHGQQVKSDQQAELQRQVEAQGGVDAVLADKKADPQLQQAARQIKFSALDKQTPEAKMKMGLLQDVQSGNSKNWSPQQHMLAAAFGVVPSPIAQTVTGKNGHQQQILVDPLTNQLVPGSKPLDLGPPQWAQEFYGKQAADHAEIRKAVESDPTAYGVQVSGDPKANKAAVDARVAQLQVNAEFGIKSLADMFGKTGYEVQRDNTILNDVVKAAGLNAKNSPLDTGEATMSYPTDTIGADGKTIKAGTTFAVGRDYFNKILSEFTATPGDNSGVRGFRATPDNPDKKPAEILDAERKFLYGWVKNQMIDQKGKAAMTPAQADAVLKQTALGTEIKAGPQGGMTAPPTPPQQSATGLDSATGLPRRMGGMEPAPSAPMKYYSVTGAPGVYQMTDEEAKMAKANHVQVELLDQSLFSQ